jgi:hypothetical protein
MTDPTVSGDTSCTTASTEVTDEYMHEMLGRSKPYTVVLLRVTEKAGEPEARGIVWEHGRRNFMLRATGKLPIVCPVTDDSDWAGIGIFDATPEEVEQIMADDPGMKAGLFTYELHPVRGFPTSSLP